MNLEKNRTYACTFPVQRKEINVAKVRFTVRYSSRKLSNDKGYNHSLQLLKTNCLFFPGYKWKHYIFRQKNIWNPVIFSDPARGSGQKSSRMLITFFRPEDGSLLKHLFFPLWTTFSTQTSLVFSRRRPQTRRGCLRSLLFHILRSLKQRRL